MTLEELKAEVRNLTTGQLVDLSCFIEREKIDRKTGIRPVGMRAEELCELLSDITGCKVNSHSRMHPLPLLRAMVYRQLIDEGYSTTEIGGFFEMNHSTILGMRRKLTDVLGYPAMYPEIADIWTKFKKEVMR